MNSMVMFQFVMWLRLPEAKSHERSTIHIPMKPPFIFPWNTTIQNPMKNHVSYSHEKPPFNHNIFWILRSVPKSLKSPNCLLSGDMGVCQNPFLWMLVGWTPIYQLFWCSPGLQGFDPKPYFFRGSSSFLCALHVAIAASEDSGVLAGCFVTVDPKRRPNLWMGAKSESPVTWFVWMFISSLIYRVSVYFITSGVSTCFNHLRWCKILQPSTVGICSAFLFALDCSAEKKLTAIMGEWAFLTAPR